MEERLFFEGLQALAASAFPKHCSYCGRVFATSQDFMRQTQSVRQDITGLKQSFDDDSVAIVEAYRNCLCGSTLMDFFTDRRDVTDAGARRRELFEKLLPHLQEMGMTMAAAREHLLALLRGREKSGSIGR
ncbi:hypothetical protein [Duganella sp. Root198D2]|uniref:hypothetical protein n=1 Tax=Duganella sp. Root198D2 TaxID=1736489 RepID=UPI00070E5F98|nr:hypothetical protein [Duganella sp. Root198D2]KRC00920.1 hypothetical protein ASE26_21625 [Duganella sp. Root198D2]